VPYAKDFGVRRVQRTMEKRCISADAADGSAADVRGLRPGIDS